MIYCGLDNYSGYFGNAAIHDQRVYLKSYSGNWFMIRGLRITDEIIIDHQPSLMQVQQ